jgi:hypothetical protein
MLSGNAILTLLLHYPIKQQYPIKYLVIFITNYIHPSPSGTNTNRFIPFYLKIDVSTEIL